MRPRRSAGQNFLTQPAIADRIVAAAALEPGAAVVEIGPGLGILTERILAAHPASLTAVELDPRLAAALRARFANPRLSVLAADFLNLELRPPAGGAPLIVIGNLPFSSAGAILRRLSDSSALIERMVLMFQREVAERIRARPGAAGCSALSVFTAMYWEVGLHFRVAAGSFHPRPKVDAEVLEFKRLSARPFDPSGETALIKTVHAAFFAPRKTIRNALGLALGLKPPGVTAALSAAAIDPAARAGALELEGFVRLSRALAERSMLRDA